MFSNFLYLISTLAVITATPLDDYVWKEDENYNYVDLNSVIEGDCGNFSWTGYTLNMTSQQWLTDDDFSPNSDSKSIWWHYLVVIIPEELRRTQNASIYITGGDVHNDYPSADSEDVIVSAALACSTGQITGTLFGIPNESTIFATDPLQSSRSEDAIIAFTWDHFLKDPTQPEWLLRFPMVKASLRAMDTITSYVATNFPELNTKLDYYAVAGASKRGWTAWDVGAVDQNRVKALVPIVLDAINFVAVEHHEYRSYGGWTYALIDYINENITERLDDPNMLTLQQNVDPYFYKERLTMPKMIVNAGMDEFQHPDDTHYWWNDMPEPKHFLILPNAEHSLATGILDAVPAISAFIQNVVLQETVPAFTWTISNTTGEIVATLADDDSEVHSATVWYANSCGVNTFDGAPVNRRDWRVGHLDAPCTCGFALEGLCVNLKAVWSNETITETIVDGKRTYSAVMDAPADGTWIAYFIDFKFVNKNAFSMDYNTFLTQKMLDDNESKNPLQKYNRILPIFPHDIGRFFEFTTEVSIWPNVFPYPDCSGSECGNRMV